MREPQLRRTNISKEIERGTTQEVVGNPTDVSELAACLFDLRTAHEAELRMLTWIQKTLEGIRAARESFRDPAQRERLARYHGAKAPWVIEAWTENWLAPGFASWSALDTLPKVHSPILAIHGEDDEYGTTRHAKLISERCGGRSQLELMAKTGHLPHREQPARVIELMSAFLRSATSPLLAS